MKSEEYLLTIINKNVEEFKAIRDDEWIKKSNPSKWSKKEILGHLIDSATTNLRRFVVTQYEQKQKIIYHQDEWVDLQLYQESNIQDNIELWKLLNLQIIRTISNIPNNKLQNICDTGKDSTEYHTLEFLIDDYIKHLKHHLGQIIEN